ncbi:MAG TPA: hypothetical protein PKY59_22415 [Pyrinomonadaceae bacterium]|nr:hypothetical protein [Pyrinomonadaceae bacterium]
MKTQTTKFIGILSLFLLTFFFSREVAAQNQPLSILLGNVEKSANTVYQFSHNSSDEELTDTDQLGSERYIKDLFDYSKECLADIDKAIAAGAAESKTVKIELRSDETKTSMSLAEIRALCKRMLKMTGAGVWKGQAEEAAQYISIWLQPLTDKAIDKTQASVADKNGKDALAKLDEARANGLSDDEELEVFDRTMTVSEAREQIVYIHDEIAKINAKFIADEKAQYAPFRAALSGDKLALYNSRMYMAGVYGAGGKLLKTPQEYANSALWCEWSVDRNSLVTTWEIGCWHFKGMTKVGNVVTRSGVGSTPPSSAFR